MVRHQLDLFVDAYHLDAFPLTRERRVVIPHAAQRLELAIEAVREHVADRSADPGVQLPLRDAQATLASHNLQRNVLAHAPAPPQEALSRRTIRSTALGLGDAFRVLGV
eukprot:scaffold388_cov244-Pinguiococcus_pyrenoidosus.AAC.35